MKNRKFYANDVDAFHPELWAASGLMELSENMVASRLVHRDYQNALANIGDTLNIQRPTEFTAIRKARSSDITVQDLDNDNVQVKMNQHIHTSFIVHDVDYAKSLRDLHATYIGPAVRSIARSLDRIVCGSAWRFRSNMGGNLNTAAGRTSVLQTREQLVVQNAPEGRVLLICPAIETKLLSLDEFVDFQRVGDTDAMKKASLGEKFGLQIWTAQNIPQVLSSLQPAQTTGAVNNVAGYGIGDTVLTVDGFTGDAAPVGAYVTIAGDHRPRQVTARSLTSSNTTSITIDGGLSAAVADDAVVTVWGRALVNLAAGYAAGYEETIAFDNAGSGKQPQVGQLVSFGSGSAEYTVIAVTAASGSGTITLDRPLEAAIVDDVRINLGPTGAYGFAFHKNALALVVRPLPTPKGAGVNVAFVGDERIGAALRVSFAYDPYKQATVCTFDLLAGIAVLDTNLGALMMTSDTVGS